MSTYRFLPPWRRAPNKPTARTRTVAKLIARLIAELGRPPSDHELAQLLATSVVHVRRHRRLLEGRGR